MGMNRNCRGIDENCRKIDLIRGSHPPWRNIKRERERERERGNSLSNEYSSMISNVELQSSIYRRLPLMSLAYMAQSLVSSTCAL